MFPLRFSNFEVKLKAEICLIFPVCHTSNLVTERNKILYVFWEVLKM
jgi:hypothetical protein